MKLIFNKPRVVDGVLYRADKEPQEVPDKALDHWFVKNCILAGDITVLPGAKMEPLKGYSKPPKKVREVQKT